MEKNKGRSTNLPSTVSRPKCLQQTGLGQTKTRSPEFHFAGRLPGARLEAVNPAYVKPGTGIWGSGSKVATYHSVFCSETQ